jgi:hypothetical protein
VRALALVVVGAAVGVEAVALALVLVAVGGRRSPPAVEHASLDPAPLPSYT